MTDGLTECLGPGGGISRICRLAASDILLRGAKAARSCVKRVVLHLAAKPKSLARNNKTWMRMFGIRLSMF